MDYLPLTVEHTHLKHSGGTKEYFVTLILDFDQSRSQRGLLLMRWGKVNTAGQFKIERYNTHGETRAALDRKLDEKTAHGKGYISLGTEGHKIEVEHDFLRFMPAATWQMLPKAHLHWVAGAGKTDSFAEEIENSLAADRRAAAERAEQARLLYERKLEEDRQAEQRRIRETNPNWGRF